MRLLTPLIKVGHRIGRAYVRRLVRDDFLRQRARIGNERAAEYSFALRQIALQSPRPEKILDVGTGRTSWPHLLYSAGFHVTAADNVTDYWPRGMTNRHWLVRDVDITNPQGFDDTFDVLTCISVLDHVVEFDRAVANMAGMLRPNGLLLLTMPFSAHQPYDPDVCARPDSYNGKTHAYRCQSYNATQLRQWCVSNQLRVTASEYWSMWSGPVFGTGQPLPWKLVSEADPHQLGCFALTPNGETAARMPAGPAAG